MSAALSPALLHCPRLRRVDYPDGTFITNAYQNLSLVSVIDRLGFTNSYGYDSMQRKIAATNALGSYTLFNYCTCGSLDSIRDAAGNFTYFYRDNVSRATNTLYPDGYSVTNWFNNQSLQVAVNNAFGQVQGLAYDILDRVTNSVDANGVSIINVNGSVPHNHILH